MFFIRLSTQGGEGCLCTPKTQENVWHEISAPWNNEWITCFLQNNMNTALNGNIDESLIYK